MQPQREPPRLNSYVQICDSCLVLDVTVVNYSFSLFTSVGTTLCLLVNFLNGGQHDVSSLIAIDRRVILLAY